MAVLMSGGVDSSVTAMLLKQAGWNILGITMRIPVASSCSGNVRPCCGEEAAFVCHGLGIPHYFLDTEKVFTEQVIEPFRRSYAEGLTPNPCVDCNTRLKFELVWNFLEEALNIRHLATGHYARVIHGAGSTRLARAADKSKDQSYFLYGVPLRRLPYLALPLGEMSKPEVRNLAQAGGLHVAAKPESMELCFAAEGDYRLALDEANSAGGPILNMAGEVIGRHDGISGYTIGQRRGLGVAAGAPLYVVRICPRENSVTVGTREEASRRLIEAGNLRVLAPERLYPGAQLYGKIRSYGECSPCTVTEMGEDSLRVEFAAPQFAPTPGQHMVLYDADESIVAGGTITS